MTEEPLLWWLTRSAGLVALLLLTASVVLGVSATRGTPSRRALVQGVHRWVSGLAVGLVVAHVVTSVADGYVPLSWVDAFVPFRAGYRPLWLGIGTLAVDLLLAVLLTSLLRSRLQGRYWRRVHVLAYAAWPLSLVHGLGAGTDVRTATVRALTAGCVVAVLLALVSRLGRDARPLRLALLVLVIGAAGAGLGWALDGPLAPGWGARAGTWSP